MCLELHLGNKRTQTHHTQQEPWSTQSGLINEGQTATPLSSVLNQKQMFRRLLVLVILPWETHLASHRRTGYCTSITHKFKRTRSGKQHRRSVFAFVRAYQKDVPDNLDILHFTIKASGLTCDVLIHFPVTKQKKADTRC